MWGDFEKLGNLAEIVQSNGNWLNVIYHLVFPTGRDQVGVWYAFSSPWLKVLICSWNTMATPLLSPSSGAVETMLTIFSLLLGKIPEVVLLMKSKYFCCEWTKFASNNKQRWRRGASGSDKLFPTFNDIGIMIAGKTKALSRKSYSSIDECYFYANLGELCGIEGEVLKSIKGFKEALIYLHKLFFGERW